MADFNSRVPSCNDDCEGERGKRGKRGKRGHRGPSGPPGSTADGAVGLAYVYRPGATGVDAPGGNVFTDWALLMGAVDSTSKLGRRDIYFDSSFQDPAPIPAGTWNMTDVRWIAVTRQGDTTVEILNGATFVLDPTTLPFNQRALQIEGYGFTLVYNGTGPVVPFDGIDIICGGNNVRLTNNDVAAAPMFRVQGFNLILFSGECVNGGVRGVDVFGTDVPLAAPVIDMNGGTLVLFGGGGRVMNNFATDLSGMGPASIIFGVTYDSFFGDFHDQWNAPAYLAAGGTIAMTTINNSVRYRVDPNFLIDTGAPVTVTESPYAAAYNELVPVDTSGGDVTVNLPSAGLSIGERVTVANDSGANDVIVGSTYGDTIRGSLTIGPGGSRTWACWGSGIWTLVAQV